MTQMGVGFPRIPEYECLRVHRPATLERVREAPAAIRGR